MKIAIGMGKNKNVLKAAEKFSDDIKIVYDKQELFDYMKKPEIDGIIRGSLDSNIFRELKKEYPKLFRASILEQDTHKFMLAPVGIDEGDSITSKKEMIKECSIFLSKNGIKPKIALISSGRESDKGRSKKIDQNILECEKIYDDLKNEYNIKHYYILIEEAIKDKANIIIAPDGISGNLIFRSLVLVAGIKSNGAVILNQPHLFMDTSRSQSVEGYMNAINFLKELNEIRSRGIKK